jgi:ribonucleoside-diphosphate reductase alpha chain
MIQLEKLEKKVNVDNNSVYSREVVYNETLKYFNGDTLATDVWINKYALKDSDGNLFEKTPDDMHKRLAKEFARIEKKYNNPLEEEYIYNLLKDFKYIVPQGGSMSGVGNDKQIVSLSNCFVIGHNYDSYGSIMKVDEEQVQLMKRRGGVGHDLSHIRPKNSPVKNSALTSTGVVPFMERYSNSTREVGQDGRRGALMLSMSVKHVDSEDFMNAKLEDGKVTGANISLRITDDFMKSVINNETYTQQYPVDSDNPKYKKDIDAKEFFDKIVHNAWKSAEPGILFWDNIINESVSDLYADLGFKTVSTNPCGELPLPVYDSCRLLVINLYSYVVNPFTKDSYFDFDKFKEHVKVAQKLMDDIVDLEIEKINKIIEKIDNDPEPEYIKRVERELWTRIKDKATIGRRTGLGVTAEGDMVAAMGLTYGTKEATDFSVEVHKVMAVSAYESSIEMAKDRGHFNIWELDREFDGKKYKSPFLQRIHDNMDNKYIEMYKKYGRRNIALLTIAPTGSVSIMTQTTSGIEPTFLVAYKRRRKINPNDKNAIVSFTDDKGDSWEEYTVLHHKFKNWLINNGYDINDIDKYSKDQLEDLVKISPYNRATSNDVDWVEKVKMQGRIQQWIDHSISVTVNLPKEVSEEIVGKVYISAWESGCKGVTVYRDGSRSGVLVSDTAPDNKKINQIIKENNAPRRPKKLYCEILRFQNNKEKWIGFTGLLEGAPYEVFTGLLESFPIPNYIESGWINKIKDKNNKSRYDFVYIDRDGYEQEIKGLSRAFNKEYWNYGKLISGVLRHGMPVPNVINLIDSLELPDTVISWKSGVKRMLKKYVRDDIADGSQVCPMCGNKLTYVDGCLTCKDTEEKEGCGWSKCG